MRKLKKNGLGKVPKGFEPWHWEFNRDYWSKNDNDVDRKDKSALRKVRSMVRQKKYDDIRFYLQEGGDTYGFEIVSSTGGKWQSENYSFGGIWLTSSCGYSGDDWSGEIWIHLRKNNYLKFRYDS